MKGGRAIHLLDAGEGFELGDWVWCLHCERCYQVGEFRLEEDFYQMCPYEGCDGSTVLDGWPWEHVRVGCDHLEYPEEPERGVVYPLYG